MERTVAKAIMLGNRTVKRVPLDFDWPLNERWEGYLNPGFGAKQCEACAGSGYSPFAKSLHDKWYGYAPFDPRETGSRPLSADDDHVLAFARRNVENSPSYYGRGETAVIREACRLADMWNGQLGHHLNQDDVDALIEGDRLGDFTRRPRTPEQAKELKRTGAYWLAESNGYRPTAEEVNRWAIETTGHDSINCWTVINARCARAYLPVHCAICDGHGEVWPSEQARADFDAWEPIEPPAGDAYQLWETCSEGSPISPPFATPEELADYAVEHCTTFGSAKADRDTWLRVIGGDERAADLEIA